MKTKPRFLATGSVALSITRTTQGGWVNGRWVEGVPCVVEIKANIQPMRDQEIMLLPESDRSREWINIYSPDEIRTEKQGADGWAADEFEWGGDMYKVMRVRHYQMGVLDHYEAKAARQEVTPD